MSKLKRSVLFRTIMLLFSLAFTEYFLIFAGNNPPFFNREFFLGHSGMTILTGLIVLSFVTGYLFSRYFGLIAAFLCIILTPIAAFFCFIMVMGGIEEWLAWRKYYRLSPEEQERIYEYNLSLDYKYSSRGP